MVLDSSEKPETRGSFWEIISAALSALAKESGCSLHHSPLPELREAARDWQS
jgi:hypothetical protein